MRSKNISLIISMLSLFVGTVAFSQSIPVTTKLGKVSLEECAMSVYPKDTSAAVVVLWESLESSTDFDLGLGIPMMRRYFTERVKILKDEAKDYADGYVLVSQDLYAHESVTRMQVTTYNLENGKVVATKMPKSDIVRSQYSDGVEKVAYAARNVKVGSVVEVHYEFTTARFFSIPDFYFQRTVPVNLCEYKIALPGWLAVGKTMSGYESIECTHEVINGVDLGTMLPANGLNVDNYRAVDLPAMKSEPMVYCTRQYRSSVSYDVKATTLPGNYQDYSRNWSDVAKAVSESDIFKRINASCKIKEEIDPIKNSDSSFMDKVVSIVNLVQSKVQWNKKLDLIPDKSADILKSHSGTSSDINALAGSAFKYAGFKVTPVLVRLRSSGILLRFKPSLKAFDTFILQIESVDGSKCYVDASDKLSYVNVLDDQFLTDSGFAVGEGIFEWVDLRSLSKNMESYFVNAAISPDGSVSGSLSSKHVNVASYDFKNWCKGFEKEEELAEGLEDRVSAEISNLLVTDVDNYTKSCNMSFEFTRTGETAGDLIFVNPFFFKFHPESMFREEDRKLPVDFDYTEIVNYNARFVIPDGYEVDKLPESTKFVSDIPSSLMLKYGCDGKTVMVSYMFKNDALLVTPEKYKDFRQYWAELSSIYMQRIVLKKVK